MHGELALIPSPPPLSTATPDIDSDGDVPSIVAVKDLLQRLLRVSTSDGRIFLGNFVCTDKQLHIILVNTEEFRIGIPSKGRFVGMIMIPWKLVLKVEAEDDGSDSSTSDGGSTGDGMYT